MRYHSGTGRQLRAERKKARVVFYGLGIIIFIYLSLSLVFGERGLLTYLHLKRSHDTLQKQLAEIRNTNETLKEEVRMLRSSEGNFIIEKKAREDLNMARDDEYIFIFRDEGKK